MVPVLFVTGIGAAKGRSPAISAADLSAPPAPAPAATPAAAPSVDVKNLPGVGASLPVSPQAKIQRVWIWQETNDCLWNMARENYGDPFEWPRIYEANRSVIKNPHVIFPKQQIVIPPLDEAAWPPAEEPEPVPPFEPPKEDDGEPPAATPRGSAAPPPAPAAAAPAQKPRKTPKKSGEEGVLDEYRWNDSRDFSKW